MKKKKNGNKTKNKDEQKKKVEPSPWVELSDDLIGEIMYRLYLSDQVRFRAVCKNWLQVADQYINNNTVSVPWVIEFKTLCYHIECRLYESTPSNLTKPTLLCNLNLSKYREYIGDTLTHKWGWIFSSIKIYSYINFLLLSPFTKKEIVLPRLAATWNNYQLLMQTFSTKPDSPNCVFLLLYRNVWKNTIIINVFCHEYKEWKCQKISNVGFSFSNMPVYIEGIFYFVNFPSGNVASYNVAALEWKVETKFSVSFPEYVWICKSFELNGELMIICLSYDGGYIRMFDRSTKAWVPLQSLGDHSIFIGDNSALVPIIAKGRKSNFGILPNKIYYGNYWEHNVYSFDSGKLAKFSNALKITKCAKATYLCGHWFEPPGDVVKRKEPRKSWRKVIPERKLLHVTEPGLDDTKSNMVKELANHQMDQTRDSTVEKDGLENLMVLNQMRRSRIDPLHHQ